MNGEIYVENEISLRSRCTVSFTCFTRTLVCDWGVPPVKFGSVRFVYCFFLGCGAVCELPPSQNLCSHRCHSSVPFLGWYKREKWREKKKLCKNESLAFEHILLLNFSSRFFFRLFSWISIFNAVPLQTVKVPFDFRILPERHNDLSRTVLFMSGSRMQCVCVEYSLRKWMTVLCVPANILCACVWER